MYQVENCISAPKYQIITDSDSWGEYIKNALNYDVYHTLQYHMLDKRGEPVLFVYEEDSTFIAFPLLKRSIENTDFCDFTSSYGYAGPVSNQKFEHLGNDFIAHFKYSFESFLKNNRAVSVFSRLNPFLNQRFLLDKIGGVRNNGKTVYIDLEQQLEQQRNRYDKRLLRQIRQLRKRGYLIKYADTQDQVRLFTSIYTKNMRRVNANKGYFFNEDYFTSLLKNSEFNCRLILVYNGHEMICGAIMMWLDGIIRNHLSATSESYIQFSPSKLLTDEISLIGRELGMKFFHLGGGVAGKEDTLFTFKLGFSDLILEDNIWCYIADNHTYNQLLEQKNIEDKNAYFPLYRKV